MSPPQILVRISMMKLTLYFDSHSTINNKFNILLNLPLQYIKIQYLYYGY